MRQFTFILLLFAFQQMNAQVKELSEDELNEIAETYMSAYGEKDLEADSTALRLKAYESFSLLVKNFQKSGKISYYLYSKGYLAYNKEEKKNCFEEVIRKNDWDFYTRKSYFILASYAIEENDCKKALQYLDKIRKMENLLFPSEDEIESYNAELKSLYERCETGIKK